MVTCIKKKKILHVLACRGIHQPLSTTRVEPVHTSSWVVETGWKPPVLKGISLFLLESIYALPDECKTNKTWCGSHPRTVQDQGLYKVWCYAMTKLKGEVSRRRTIRKKKHLIPSKRPLHILKCAKKEKKKENHNIKQLINQRLNLNHCTARRNKY